MIQTWCHRFINQTATATSKAKATATSTSIASTSRISFNLKPVVLHQSFSPISTFAFQDRHPGQRTHPLRRIESSRGYHRSTAIFTQHRTLRQVLPTPTGFQPRALSDDPALLPPGYTFYPYHSDKPNTPPTMVHIISSPHTPPPLPRSSVFDYLFPPPGSTKEYYPKPDPDSVAFIDGLTGEEVTRGQVEEQAIKLASGLRGLGIKRGDVGMTFGFNSLQYINAIMGIQAAGAVVSPANAA